MSKLRASTIRLAYANPELRPVLLPLLSKTAGEVEFGEPPVVNALVREYRKTHKNISEGQVFAKVREYTDARANAIALTRRVSEDGDDLTHSDAERAHSAAAKKAKTLGLKEEAAKHSRQAAFHKGHISKTAALSSRVADAAFSNALDALVDGWADGFLDILKGVKVSPEDVEKALFVSGLTADGVNGGLDTEAVRTAGLGDWVKALGGKILKSAWHSLVHPFVSAWKLVVSPSYRGTIKKALKRVVSHEIRSTKHMARVAMRLAQGEEIPPQEVRAAALQFVDILTKVLLGVIVGPHIAHLFAAGPLRAMMALMSPLDEVAGVLLDAPIRWASRKFLGGALGLLPSGFYTHF